SDHNAWPKLIASPSNTTTTAAYKNTNEANREFENELQEIKEKYEQEQKRIEQKYKSSH
ncbi:unnamed protein product, partial [Didymodactylos carnosus]